MTQPEDLKTLLHAVALGDVSPEDAIAKLKHFSYERVGDFANNEHQRGLRHAYQKGIWVWGKHQ
ncbi:MAG: 1-(5-phosphoribosyl)-5-amino-4-imidazole-carboxylate carboxylase, partial [Phormidesmis sp. CAN_BIN36]|nr:1-(5-phosphoribosyl)-5-amino-4-imidazole-carboxylate carboxylase [Phormidesmis sp. CAN_BIN36]